ncbi:MAG: hypothetical protein ACOY4U_04520 [Pseudomonadota bacterium]
MKRLPQSGLRGTALREAVETDYRTIIDMVRNALDKKLNGAPGNPVWFDLDAVYPDRAVICLEGKHFSYPYTIDAENQLTLGDAQEVMETYVPIKEAVFLEASADVPGKYLIRVIRAGASLNNNFYPDAVLRESAPMFEGARVFVKPDIEHLKGGGKDFDKLIGKLSGVKFVEGKQADTGETQAVLQLIEPDGEVATKIREAVSRDMADLFGFSVDVLGKSKSEMREGRKLRVATRITKVNSVDLIVEPGAGGQLIRMVESVNQEEQSDMSMRAKMLQTIKDKAPAKFAAINPDTVTDDELESAYREAVAVLPDGSAPAADGGDVREEIRMVEARANMRAAVGGCNLPQPAKDRLLADFGQRARFTEADVTAAIDGERQYLARFTESGHVSLDFDAGARAEDRSVKMGDMLDAFFDPAHKDHRNVRSFRECYIEITGDKRVTGRLEHCDRSRLVESVGAAFRESLDSSSFANVLGSSITRRLVAEYNAAADYDIYRNLCTAVPVNDFRTQERTRYGGYGDLPAVAESGAYAPLASPTDEKATYAVTKRGGTEDVTLEMIKNDDVGSIQRIPVKLGRAAKRTLSKFVLDFIRTNPTIYDGLALFHATHGNLGSAALDATSLAARRLAMLKQAELSSTDRLGIGPKYLWVPVDLQESAVNLFNRNTNLDKTFVQTMSLEIMPVWYWTDATDWALSADPRDIPTIELGFLDGNEEPELFVQDNPSVGSMFSNDKLTYKMRHIYGGNVLDFRGIDKSVVAG